MVVRMTRAHSRFIIGQAASMTATARADRRTARTGWLLIRRTDGCWWSGRTLHLLGSRLGGAAATAAILLDLLLLPALGPTVLEPNLHPGLWQIDLEGHFFAHEDVRVARLGEEGFQDVQLGAGEGGAFASLLPGCGGCRREERRNYAIETVLAFNIVTTIAGHGVRCLKILVFHATEVHEAIPQRDMFATGN